MASFAVNCSFTFHNFARGYEKKAFHKPPRALASTVGDKIKRKEITLQYG
jgi:hypothetical protein